MNRSTVNAVCLLAAPILLLATHAAAASRHADPANEPDRVAWEILIEASRPAGVPNLVDWQTWISSFTLYGEPCEVPRWPEGPERARLKKSGLLETIENHFVSGASPFNSEEREQVMLNRTAFDYVVDSELWFSEGVLARALADGIDFPQGSVILKSNWKEIDDSEKDRYHWQRVTKTGETGEQELVLVGLNAFHVTSKVLPNWLWSTFEHVDNPGRCDAIGCKDRFGSDPPYVPPHREPGRLYGEDRLTPALLAMMDAAGLDPVWRNYRLKGTQITFTDVMGRPILLGNSVLEPNFEATSSCMTCHTRASVSNNTTVAQTAGTSTGLSVLSSFTPLQGHVGAPDPSWFLTSQTSPPVRSANIVWRTDFLWELTKLLSNRECETGAADDAP